MTDKAALHKSLMQLYLGAIIEVFKTQCSVDAKIGTPGPYLPDQFKGELDITASVGILSPQFTGSMMIGFPTATFLKVASAVLGEEFKQIDAGNQDFCSELLNMILGVTKTNFSKVNDIVISPAIPMVVQGKSIKFNLPPDCPTILFPFESSFGSLYAALTVKWMS